MMWLWHFQVFIVGLLSDVKYSHFKPVLDLYIEETFSATLAYKCASSLRNDTTIMLLSLVWKFDQKRNGGHQKYLGEVRRKNSCV